MKTEKAPQKKEKLPQKELRRDPAFRRELSRAWGVEEPPEAYRKALEETYTRLPDGPIARSRPLHTVLRGLCTAAAACIALGIILIGLNATEPQLTEGLPGLGTLFQQVNEGWRQRNGGEIDLFHDVEQETELFQLPVEDNGTVLKEIKLLDGNIVQITAQVPYMGRKSYIPMYYEDLTPFGAYAELQGKTASSFTAEELQAEGALTLKMTESSPLPADRTDIQGQPNQTFRSSSATTTIKLSDSPFTVTWTFSGVQELGQSCILTLYDWDGKLAEGETVEKHVTADFTLNLQNAAAAPSESYLCRGLRKITPEECLETDRAPEKLSQGWCVGKIESVSVKMSDRVSGNSFYRIDLFGEPGQTAPGVQELALEYWLNGSLLGTRSLQKSDTYEISEKERTLLRKAIGNLDWYVSGLGIYAAEEITEASRTGRARRHLIVIFPISEADLESGVFLKNGVLRFSLRDSAADKLLIEDLAEDLRQNYETLKDAYSEN